jgi:hypothetical protein
MAVGVLAIGAAIALAPAAPSWAGQHKSDKHHKTTKSHTSKKAGSNPGGSLCQLVKKDEAESQKGSAALEKAMTAGNWKLAQKDLLSSFNEGEKLEGQVEGALQSAPANVRSAAAQSLKFVGTEKKIIEDSTSVAGFESAFETAAESPQLEAASKTLTAYQTAQCGSVTTTT